MNADEQKKEEEEEEDWIDVKPEEQKKEDEAKAAQLAKIIRRAQLKLNRHRDINESGRKTPAVIDIEGPLF